MIRASLSVAKCLRSPLSFSGGPARPQEAPGLGSAPLAAPADAGLRAGRLDGVERGHLRGLARAEVQRVVGLCAHLATACSVRKYVVLLFTLPCYYMY